MVAVNRSKKRKAVAAMIAIATNAAMVARITAESVVTVAMAVVRAVMVAKMAVVRKLVVKMQVVRTIAVKVVISSVRLAIKTVSNKLTPAANNNRKPKANVMAVSRVKNANRAANVSHAKNGRHANRNRPVKNAHHAKSVNRVKIVARVRLALSAWRCVSSKPVTHRRLKCLPLSHRCLLPNRSPNQRTTALIAPMSA